MIRVIDENTIQMFEANCAKAMDEGYKLSSSSCVYVPQPHDCNYFIAIFYKE